MSNKVALHIYDVSTNPEIEKLNKYLTAVGTGAFHGGVEVFGQEYSFGYCKDGPGIFSNAPKGCTMHHFRESVELGETSLSEAEVKSLVEEMKPDWPGCQYDLIRRNCVIFSAEFARRLGVKEVPKWVTNLAGAGATIQDGAMQAATKAQAAAIMAAAKAGEMNAKYDLSGQASAKIGDMLTAAQGLDEKYQIKEKAGQAAVKGAAAAAKGAEMAKEGAQKAKAKAQELDEQYKIKENAAVLITKGGEMAHSGAQKAIFKVGELAEKHQVKEKFNDIKEKGKVKMQELEEKHHIKEKLNANGCGACSESCTVM